MAVKGYVGWQRSEEFPLQLMFGFAFEADRLPPLLEYFETISGDRKSYGSPAAEQSPAADGAIACFSTKSFSSLLEC